MQAVNLSAESMKAAQGSNATTDETASTCESEASTRKIGPDIRPVAHTSNSEGDEFVAESHTGKQFL